MSKKLAKRGWGDPYECHFDWPENCFVQCGGSGIVFTKEGALETVLTAPEEGIKTISSALKSPSGPEHYVTAFFEAFPRDPSCFLRGEGKSIEEAEASCWEWYQRVVACGEHEFDRRGRRDGYGFCKKCNMGSMFAGPLDTCCVCNVPTCFAYDADQQAYCREHLQECPEEKRTRSIESTLRMMADGHL